MDEQALPWEWRYLDEAGVEMAGPDITFDGQEAAEAWLTATFPVLADLGITAVTLFDGEHVVYGPMPLAAE